ncbi:unnamed protein product [Arctia plantaginis]|uniref:Uncharacterized protein n=1 Tax=Arctia plantaginis TaxID=874455 RepID=A0A8S0ZB85_ARCPL|nr:unnamed protein product [Arctia plantaginis]
MLRGLINTVPHVIGLIVLIDGHFRNLAWNGGPMHVQCEHGLDVWMKTGQYTKENVIATKAFIFQDEVYVITPRMKTGILATLWLIVQEKNGVELQPFPELRTHKQGDCSGIQNAVDFYLDHFSKLWILDSGVVDTLTAPKCTCPPKVIVVSMVLGKLVKIIDISSAWEPNSLLQNIVIEHTLAGKTFIYISDASRGAILVLEVGSGSEWPVVVCSPAPGLQIALVKQPTHSVLIVVRLHYHGIIELDTAALRRKDSVAPLTIFGEHSKPVVLLGTYGHNVFFRHTECSDVLVWDMRLAYNSSRLDNIHSAGPRLTTTAVAAIPFKPVLLVLDSNYLDTLHGSSPTYHKITFITNYHF